MQPSIEDKAF